jgi:hypothetical protein
MKIRSRHARPVGDFGSFGGESEHLFLPGSIFKVTGLHVLSDFGVDVGVTRDEVFEYLSSAGFPFGVKGRASDLSHYPLLMTLDEIGESEVLSK